MRVLGRFFTLKLGISEGHYIVDTGPYRFLRHPSYTGILLATFPLVHLTVAPTLHEAILPFITKVLGIVALNFGTGSYVSQAILGLVGVLEDSLVSNFIGLLISSSILAFHTYNLCILRIPQEETMLKKTFGENWDKFAATRARIVPFIY
ncbi:hypothetical protein BDF22DRAFT_673717 [Syncephalis plumigaleata]|nr:hypothetical protein BDF22DRAFT_673717 [Syncephalis plumigaleata]